MKTLPVSNMSVAAEAGVATYVVCISSGNGYKGKLREQVGGHMQLGRWTGALADASCKSIPENDFVYMLNPAIELSASLAARAFRNHRVMSHVRQNDRCLLARLPSSSVRDFTR